MLTSPPDSETLSLAAQGLVEFLKDLPPSTFPESYGYMTDDPFDLMSISVSGVPDHDPSVVIRPRGFFEIYEKARHSAHERLDTVFFRQTLEGALHFLAEKTFRAIAGFENSFLITILASQQDHGLSFSLHLSSGLGPGIPVGKLGSFEDLLVSIEAIPKALAAIPPGLDDGPSRTRYVIDAFFSSSEERISITARSPGETLCLYLALRQPVLFPEILKDVSILRRIRIETSDSATALVRKFTQT